MDNIDVKKLEFLYQEASANLRCLNIVLENLRSENEHLRHIIEILITNQIS